MQIKKSVLVTLAAGMVALGGCSSGNASAPGGNISPVIDNTSSLLTVDASATYPVISGAQGVATVIIHNDSDEDAKDISFTLSNNIDNKTTSLTSACSSLGAGGICRVNVPVPAGISARTRNGSALLTVSYKTKAGKTQTTNGLVNFKYLDTADAGVHVNTVALSNLGKSKSRGVVYVYAGGAAGNVYNIANMQSTNPGFNISSGDLTGLQLASGSVQAVEIEGIAPNYVEKSTLDIISQAKGKTYTEEASVPVLPKLNLDAGEAFPSIDAGFVPVRDLAKDGDAVKLYFINDGNIDLDLTQPSATTGVTIKPGAGSCAGKLKAGEACEVDATLAPTSSLEHGRVTVSDLNRKGISAAGTLAWFSDAGQVEAVALSVDPDNLVLSNEPKKVTVTVSNIGGKSTIVKPVDARELFDEANITGTVDQTSLTGKDGHCSTTGELAIGQSCQYTVNFSSTSTELASHSAILEVQNDAGQVTGSQLEHWTVTNTEFPDLTMSPNPLDLHGVASSPAKTKKVKIVNTATQTQGKTTADAQLNGVYLSKIDSLQLLGIEDTKACPTIKPGEFCEVGLKLNSDKVAADTSLEDTSDLVVSGNFTTVSDPITYGVRPSKWGLSLALDYSGNLTGTGSQDDHLVVSGGAAGDKTVTMTITNTGEETQTLKGIKTLSAIDPAIWELDAAQSDCFAGNLNTALNKQLAPQDSCKLVFNNVYGQKHGYAAAAVTVGSQLLFPKLVVQQGDNSYTTTVPLQEKPDPVQSDLNGEVYVDNQQATVTNNASIKDGAITVTHTLAAGGVDYQGNISVMAKVPAVIFDLGSFKPSAGSECRYTTAEAGMLQLSCDLTPDNNTMSYTIDTNQAYFTEDYLLPIIYDFDTTSKGQIIGMDNWAASLVIPNKK